MRMKVMCILISEHKLNQKLQKNSPELQIKDAESVIKYKLKLFIIQEKIPQNIDYN